MALNLEKLARLEANAEAANSAICSLWDAHRAHVVEAQHLRAQAVSNAPDVQHLHLSALNQLAPADLGSFGADMRALRAANLEMVTARELNARCEAMRATTRATNTLLEKLRRYAAGGLSFTD
jgi:hypothetical protein